MKDNREMFKKQEEAADIAKEVRADLGVKAVQQAEPVEHIMQFFQYAHLPEALQMVSAPFCEIAAGIVNIIPRNPERTVALRKLLEAKDAAVRALIAQG